MQYLFIEQQSALEQLCQQLAQSSLLAIDTEFVRTRTYFAQLGLLQVANGDICALIDPLAVDDLSSFWQLLADENIVKVLHACSEDIEIFKQYMTEPPKNMIDSQVMMAFLDHGLSFGYAATIEHILSVELDKSESRSNWLQRPLTEAQKRYAYADVEYLIKAYPAIEAQLEQTQFLPLAQQECDDLLVSKFQLVSPEQQYLSVTGVAHLNQQQLNRLKYLAAWRYQLAIDKDVPISRVVKDQTLLSVAQKAPKHIGAMFKLPSVDALDVRHQGKAMLAQLMVAEQQPSDTWPAALARLDQISGYKGLFKSVKHLLSQIAEQQGIPLAVLASKKQINQCLLWHFGLNQVSEQDVVLLNSWRGTLCKTPLIHLLKH